MTTLTLDGLSARDLAELADTYAGWQQRISTLAREVQESRWRDEPGARDLIDALDNVLWDFGPAVEAANLNADTAAEVEAHGTQEQQRAADIAAYHGSVL